MQREQVDRRQLPRKRKLPDVLPLDPRDPDVVRAKDLIETQIPPRRRAA